MTCIGYFHILVIPERGSSPETMAPTSMGDWPGPPQDLHPTHQRSQWIFGILSNLHRLGEPISISSRCYGGAWILKDVEKIL